MMKRIILSGLFLLGLSAPAFAVTCSNTTPQLKDNTGTTFVAPYVDDGTGSGACEPVVKVGNASPNGAHNVANSPTVNIANDQLTATGAAPPSSAFYLGANASGATGGQLRGLINCDSHVFKHITSATDTLAVQGVASQTIYICGWRSRAAGVATWFLENTASANANCSSSNTQITGVATEAANTGEVAKSAFWDGLKNTSGNGLCINSTGTGGVDVDIWYTQF